MIHRYLEAFFRNRWLVAIPVFVALSVGALYGYSQPRLYQAQSSLWFDQPVAVNPSSSYQTYADQGVSVITELLATKTVDMNIAKEGPLDQYLQTPKTDLMSKISGKVSHLLGSTSTSGPVDPTTLQNAVESVLQDPKELKVSSTGPEVVGISFTSQDPNVAAGTITALLTEFTAQMTSIRSGQVELYQAQYDSQSAAVNAADAALSKYLAQHPEIVTNNPAKPPTDPTYLALNQASTGAHQQASDLLQKLSQSQVDVQNANQPGALGFRVIDPPQVPRQSTGHSKNIILGGGIGLGVGLLIALILLLILVLGDDTVRNAKELAALTGLEVVGSAPLDGEFARRPAPPRTVGTATRGG